MSQTYISQIAPEWFEAKAIEVKGEGYPDLSDVPATRALAGGRSEWDLRAARLKDEAAALEARIRADGPILPDEDIRAMAAQWRAMLDDREAGARAAPRSAPARTGP
jgi:hypothetical protein